MPSPATAFVNWLGPCDPTPPTMGAWPRRFLLWLGLGAVTTATALEPAALFTDHAVLQRDQPVPVWGRGASPGETIRVEFAEVHTSTVADEHGNWRAVLPPLAASSHGRSLTVTGTHATRVIHDILVGEVWIASGQSNMARPLARSRDGALDAPAAGRLHRVREFLVTRQSLPQSDDVRSETGWLVAGPDRARSFSAVAFYFARELHAHLDLPIGIIHSAWGGTPVEAWTSRQTLETTPAGRTVLERWSKLETDYPAARADHERRLTAWNQQREATSPSGRLPRDPPGGPGHAATPAGLYHGMLHGLAPYALRGVIWYQGEANVGRAADYRVLFPAMIQDWRRLWDSPELPFYWVQLAAFADEAPARRDWAWLREAQTQTLALPHTGQAVALDLGDARDIHPSNKLDVGRRLARLALNRTYQVPMADEGPVFLSAAPEGDGLRLRFSSALGGLVTPHVDLPDFEVAGADRDFHPAVAHIDGDTVFVRAEAVAAPVAVRYAWRNYPSASLYDLSGLPAAPFRSDDW